MSKQVSGTKPRITQWKAGRNVDGPGIFVRLTRREAYALVRGLMSQLLHENPNVDRWETHLDGNYFTIGILDADQPCDDARHRELNVDLEPHKFEPHKSVRIVNDGVFLAVYPRVRKTKKKP